MRSPCKKTCELDIELLNCVSCKRTQNEIARWSQMTPSEQDVIMDDLPNRPQPKKQDR